MMAECLLLSMGGVTRGVCFEVESWGTESKPGIEGPVMCLRIDLVLLTLNFKGAVSLPRDVVVDDPVGAGTESDPSSLSLNENNPTSSVRRLFFVLPLFFAFWSSKSDDSKGSRRLAKTIERTQARMFRQNLKFFCWNVQGCGDPKFLTAARQLLRDSRPDVVGFVEPRINGHRADSIIHSLGFPNSHRIECRGFSGGIWLCWFDFDHVDILLNHFQFIHCRITHQATRTSVLATLVYGSPNAIKRKVLWPSLHSMASSITSPWILLGLRDLGFQGPHFTWNRGSTYAHLDRVICNSHWNEAFPESVVQHLLHFKCMLSDNWDSSLPLSDAIFKFTQAVEAWNKYVFGYVGTKKCSLMARL
ncbi:hypothetical protein V6N13_019889 [Hibiscus sabdariffa]